MGGDERTKLIGRRMIIAKYDTFETSRPSRPVLGRKRRDIICDTVDSWARKNSSTKNVLSSLKHSFFSKSEPAVVYKPLVFGGTYPIDSPTPLPRRREVAEIKSYDRPKVRQYGPAKSFDIDIPI